MSYKSKPALLFKSFNIQNNYKIFIKSKKNYKILNYYSRISKKFKIIKNIILEYLKKLKLLKLFKKKNKYKI